LSVEMNRKGFLPARFFLFSEVARK